MMWSTVSKTVIQEKLLGALHEAMWNDKVGQGPIVLVSSLKADTPGGNRDFAQ